MDQSLLDETRRYARACHEEELALLRTLGTIPSPTGHEDQRAAFVASWLTEQGANNVQVDELKNVICLLGDAEARSLVVFAAHTDIVFDDQDLLPIEERDGKFFGPGIGDDTANLVGLLMATKYLLAHPQLLPADKGMLVVANSCEEGLGNLAGTRALFDTFGERIEAFTSFDLYLPQCISTAVGSRRFRITVHTGGGHSYHDFGRPNAIAKLCALVNDLHCLPLPDQGATYNVGRIEGGTTVNSIASEAMALFEVRATTEQALASLQTGLEDTIARHQAEGVDVSLEVIGVRPGNGPVNDAQLSALTERNLNVIRTVTGLEPDRSPASTDANIPLSRGIPANTIGAVRGALLHTREEWIETESLKDGLAVILGVMLSSL